jgi:hypothetical protein
VEHNLDEVVMVYRSIGSELPIFNRRLVLAVLIIAAAGVAFGAAVVLLLGQPVL